MLLKEHEQLPPMLQQPGPEVHVIGRGCGQRSCELAVLLETGQSSNSILFLHKKS